MFFITLVENLEINENQPKGCISKITAGYENMVLDIARNTL